VFQEKGRRDPAAAMIEIHSGCGGSKKGKELRIAEERRGGFLIAFYVNKGGG